jgi:hypothetical protein
MTKHIEGFEEFAGETTPANALARADYDVSGQWALVAGRSVLGTALSARGAALTRRMEWKSDKFAVGFAHQFDGRGSVAWLTIGATPIVLWMNSTSGRPYINDSVGGALPTSNRWYYYEFEIERATGIVSLFINNRPDSTYDIGFVPTEEEVLVSLGYLAPSEYRADPTSAPQDNSVKTYDDFYAIDGARLGPIVVTTRFPAIDKNVQWFAADPNKTHSQSLALHPPNPLDNYVASANIGQEDRFTSAQALANDNEIIATGLVVLARKSETLNAKLNVFIGGQSGADLRQDTRDIESDWRTQYVFFDKNQADTVAAITAADFGIKVSP